MHVDKGDRPLLVPTFKDEPKAELVKESEVEVLGQAIVINAIVPEEQEEEIVTTLLEPFASAIIDLSDGEIQGIVYENADIADIPEEKPQKKFRERKQKEQK